MIVLASRKRATIFQRRKRKKDTHFVEYKHYTNIIPAKDQFNPLNKKTQKILNKLKNSRQFKRK
jgi:hypothetical protein